MPAASRSEKQAPRVSLTRRMYGHSIEDAQLPPIENRGTEKFLIGIALS
jgi:hypothetical protein